MLDWMFVLLFVTAICFMAYAVHVEKKDPFWNILLTAICIMIFFVLAAGSIELESSYAFFNVTSGALENGVYSYVSETNIYLSYLFSFFGVLCILYIVVVIIDWVKENM